MDLSFTPEELSFRDAIRQWVATNLPEDISRKVRGALRLSRDDHQRWARILGQKGWLGWGWPTQFGGSWLECRAEAPVRRGMRSGRSAAGDSLRPGDGGAGDHGLWLPGTAEALPAGHRQR